MSAVLEIEKAAPAPEPPKLLVDWTSRRREFLECVRPALARSERRLAGEAPFGLIPLRIMLPSYLVEAFLIAAAIFIQVKIEELRPYVAPQISAHDVIYYSGDELPRTEDFAGAQAGTAGVAGGSEADHRTQTIKVARGGSLTQQVVDAPNVKLPTSTAPVANLLAVNPNPGPPPAEGLRSARSVPNLNAAVVAPAPNVIRDYTRNGVQLDSVIAPAPSVTRDRPLIAPNFSPTLIPPAPEIAGDRKLVAPSLAPNVIAPAPSVTRDRTLRTPSLDAAVVAPAPTVTNDSNRSRPAMAATVIPPAPSGVSRESTRAPVQMTTATVVPPPVSAPERSQARDSKLNLPAPSVVAPPPSGDVSSDMRRLAGNSMPDPSRSVVPPPPQQASTGFMSSLIGKIFGPAEVVPPPPSVNAKSTTSTAPSLASNVVPPPPAVAVKDAQGRGSAASLGNNVVAPPPSVGMAGGSSSGRSMGSAPYLGNPGVVPPPPSLPGNGGGTGTTGGGVGGPNGTLLASNVVPPPPSVGGGTNSSGSGLGRKGVGLGAPVDPGAGLAPPKTGGSVASGTVMSTQPGPKLGIPATGGTGSLAMAPSGGDKVGVGGNGGGAGIGNGTGPGSGANGAGTGAATNGVGRGSDASAHGGISPAKGPGGAGNDAAGMPAVRGVDISGGSSVVTLPSFGGGEGNSPSGEPAMPARTPLKHSQTLGVTIVGTAGSGGAFEPYKNLLKGEKGTAYLDTSLGTVVMEFAAQNGTSGFGNLTSPVQIRVDLPEGLPHARMVVTGKLDASGNLSNLRVLEPGPATMTAKVLAAMRGWKFQPVMRNNQPIEVTAILGFAIDTNDQF